MVRSATACHRMSNVTVAVRVRPLNSKEQARGAYNVLEVQDAKQIKCVVAVALLLATSHTLNVN